MFIIFFILALLFAIESSTSLARRAGYAANDAVSGLMLQSSLALLSRLLMFFFMPILGTLADNNNLKFKFWEINLYYSMTIVSLGLIVLFWSNIEDLYLRLIYQIKETGSFFAIRKYKGLNTESNTPQKKLKSGVCLYKKFKFLYTIHFLAYVPYYLSWPLVVILLNIFNEHRATIIGLSSVLNGINTIILTLFIDPKLAQLGKYNLLISIVYLDLSILRFYSSIFGLGVLILFLLIF